MRTPVSANTVPVTTVNANGEKLADTLQKQAFDAASVDSFGFPVLDGINADALGAVNQQDVDLQAADQINAIDACPLNTISNCNGDCGVCPECTCEETLTTFQGPSVNLACPVVNTVAQPVNLVSPVICPAFENINIAPQATLVLPQVNTQLNCFDIECGDCGCPIKERPVKEVRR